VCEFRVWPGDWKKFIYIPIPKKGDPKECANYRTIALISQASKILLKEIKSRMEGVVERELPDVQARFRKRTGTRDKISNLRGIMEKSHEYNLDVYMCFIDYTKAFDNVNHSLMWTTLREMGIPEHLTSLYKVLHSLYKDQVATVRTEHGETDTFTIGKGIRQGCILSPLLIMKIS